MADDGRQVLRPEGALLLAVVELDGRVVGAVQVQVLQPALALLARLRPVDVVDRHRRRPSLTKKNQITWFNNRTSVMVCGTVLLKEIASVRWTLVSTLFIEMHQSKWK